MKTAKVRSTEKKKKFLNGLNNDAGSETNKEKPTNALTHLLKKKKKKTRSDTRWQIH